MYAINDQINLTDYNGLNVSKLLEFKAQEVLQVTLEKSAIFPKHTSPNDAFILVLEGKINFNINASEYKLVKHQIFDFPKNVEHWVEALENAKFLILR